MFLKNDKEHRRQTAKCLKRRDFFLTLSDLNAKLKKFYKHQYLGSSAMGLKFQFMGPESRVWVLGSRNLESQGPEHWVRVRVPGSFNPRSRILRSQVLDSGVLGLQLYRF